MATNRSDLEVGISGRDELSPDLQRLESRIIRFVGAASAALATIKIGGAPIFAAAAFEREMANVQKTTDDATKSFSENRKAIKAMGKDILELSTHTSTSALDLAKIAAAAGQQGLGRYGKEGILAFTESVARMSSVLDLSAEESGKAIGKISNLFRIPLANIEQASSTLNETVNQTTADAGDLLDIVRRLGDAGGSLDLAGSTALAASALDFGVTPEVAASTLNAFFSEAKGQAAEFGKLMGVSATQWTTKVKKDGLGAFKDFVKQVRTLSDASQQKALTNLVGGGRQRDALSKYVQDTSDSVLNRAIAAANQGKEGLSSIKEEQTVLSTLTEQVRLLGNSLFKLGTESADALLTPLTQYAAQMSIALQTPGVKRFVGAVVQTLGDMIDGLATAVKFVSSLNVNWENFLQIAKAFAALKVAEIVGGMTLRMLGLGASLKAMSADARGTAKSLKDVGDATRGVAAAEASANASKGNFLARLVGIDAYLKKQQELTAAILVRKQAEEALALSVAEGAQAQSSAAKAGTPSSPTPTAVSPANRVDATRDVARRKQQLQQAQQALTEVEANSAAALASRVTTIEREGAAKRLDIKQSFYQTRKALVAQGAESELATLASQERKALELERKARQASIASLRAGYAERAALQRAALAEEIVRAEAAVAAALATQAKVVPAAAQRAPASAGGTPSVVRPEDIDSAAKAVQAASTRQASLAKQQQVVLNNALAAEQRTFQAKVLAAEEGYQQKRTALGTGASRRQIAGLKADLAAQIEALTAHSKASETKIQAYYTARFEKQAAAYARELATARAHHAAMQAALTPTGAAAATAGSAGAAITAGAGAAGAALGGLATKLSVFERVKVVAQSAFAAIGGAITTLASVVVKAGRFLLGGFLWVTVIYSLADAVGIIDKLGPAFQRVTDALGFTSAALRKQRVESDEAAKAAAKLTLELEEQTQAYRDNIDARTGQQNTGNLAALVETASSGDPDRQRGAIAKQGNLFAGVQKAIDDDGKLAKASIQASIKVVEQEIADGSKRLTDLQFALQQTANAGGRSGPGNRLGAEKIRAEIGVLSKVIDAGKTKLAEFQASLADTRGADRAREALKQLGPAFAAQFTSASAKAFEKFVLPITLAAEEVKRLEKAHKDALEAARAGGEGTGEAATAAEAKLKAARGVLEKNMEGLRAFIQEQKALGLTEEQLKPFEALYSFLNLASGAARAIATALGVVDPALLTGRLAPVITNKPASGTKELGDSKGADKAESQARKLAKLRLAGKKIESENELNLTEEFNKQELDAQQHLYDEGLKSIADFYAKKRAISLASNDAELLRKQSDLDAAEDEFVNAKDKVEKQRFANEKLRIIGDIEVLQARRTGIDKDIDEQERKASKDFKSQVSSETLRLKTEEVIPTDTADLFQSTLNEMVRAHEVFIKRLEASENPAEQALAKALRASFNVQAFQASVAPIQGAIDQVYGSLQRQQERIGISREQGALTGLETEIAYSDAIKAQLPVLQQKAKLLGDEIKAKEASGKLTGVLLEKEKTKYDELLLSIERLGAQTDKVAKDMNKALSDNVTDALDKLTQYGSSLKDVVRGFLFDMAGIVKKALLNNFVEQGLQKIGSTGSGGFGGFFQNLFNKDKKDAKTGPTGAKGDEVNVNVSNLPPAAAPLPGAAAALPLNTPIPVQTAEVTSRSLDEAQADDSTQRLSESQQTAATASDSAAEGLANLAGSVNKAGLSMDIAAAATGNFAPLLNRITDSLLNKGISSLVSSVAPAVAPAATGAVAGVAGEAVGATAVGTAGTTVATALGTAGAAISGALATIATTIGTMTIPLQTALTALTSAIAAAAAQAAAAAGVKAVGAAAAVAHTGGIIGSSGMATRIVHPMLFAGAPRYHGGGTAGIRPGEVPTILEEGEAVLTERQQETVSAAMDSSKNATPMNIRNVLVTDNSYVTDAMSSSQGEKTMMTFITKNRMGIRQALGN